MAQQHLRLRQPLVGPHLLDGQVGAPLAVAVTAREVRRTYRQRNALPGKFSLRKNRRLELLRTAVNKIIQGLRIVVLRRRKTFYGVLIRAEKPVVLDVVNHAPELNLMASA